MLHNQRQSLRDLIAAVLMALVLSALFHTVNNYLEGDEPDTTASVHVGQ
jgi:uncharacterized membrane protein (DUF373 family)